MSTVRRRSSAAPQRMAKGKVARKVQVAAASAATIGPALIIIVQWLIAMYVPAMPDTVRHAITALIEAGVALLAAYLARPHPDDIPVADVGNPDSDPT